LAARKLHNLKRKATSRIEKMPSPILLDEDALERALKAREDRKRQRPLVVAPKNHGNYPFRPNARAPILLDEVALQRALKAKAKRTRQRDLETERTRQVRESIDGILEPFDDFSVSSRDGSPQQKSRKTLAKKQKNRDRKPRGRGWGWLNGSSYDNVSVSSHESPQQEEKSRTWKQKSPAVKQEQCRKEVNESSHPREKLDSTMAAKVSSAMRLSQKSSAAAKPEIKKHKELVSQTPSVAPTDKRGTKKENKEAVSLRTRVIGKKSFDTMPVNPEMKKNRRPVVLPVVPLEILIDKPAMKEKKAPVYSRRRISRKKGRGTKPRKKYIASPIVEQYMKAMDAAPETADSIATVFYYNAMSDPELKPIFRKLCMEQVRDEFIILGNMDTPHDLEIVADLVEHHYKMIETGVHVNRVIKLWEIAAESIWLENDIDDPRLHIVKPSRAIVNLRIVEMLFRMANPSRPNPESSDGRSKSLDGLLAMLRSKDNKTGKKTLG
jgi:hypothetical protein